jgi:hypothetical protein
MSSGISSSSSIPVSLGLPGFGGASTASLGDTAWLRRVRRWTQVVEERSETHRRRGQATIALGESAASELALADIARARRRGQVLIDWSQEHHKTVVAPYSLRAGDVSRCSVPFASPSSRRRFQPRR